MFWSSRNKVLLISILFISIGIFLRLYQLNFENYWHDEMLSFWVADPNLSLEATFSRNEHIDQALDFIKKLQDVETPEFLQIMPPYLIFNRVELVFLLKHLLF